MIKPIETRYKGYRFRSRLEARWAVFFDALGLEWEYEPEGFDLGDGVYYLPDFRVALTTYYRTDEPPEKRTIYVEVKGGSSAGNECPIEDVDKITRFSQTLHYNDEFWFLGDIPQQRVLYVFPVFHARFLPPKHQPGVRKWEYSVFADITHLLPRGIGVYTSSIQLEHLENFFSSDVEIPAYFNEKYAKCFRCYQLPAKRGWRIFTEAFDKARQARFEHGECG
ncbi:MAG: hypothetical protein IPO05_18320 [Flavobacteriales bacterium]|nr:hypothetical protein [Flavobacteriales bacterium]